MSTALKISPSIVPARRTASPDKPSPTPTSTPQYGTSLTQEYKRLTWKQKAGWREAANTLNAQAARAGRPRLTPARAFVTLNGALEACGLAISRDAPTNLSAPPALDCVTVFATNAGGRFSLRLGAPAYSCPLWILAAPPCSAGGETLPDSAFEPIGALDALQSGTANDITEMYTNAYGAPPAGAQIALQLVGTSPAGVRRSPVGVCGRVSAITSGLSPGKRPPLTLG